MTPEHAVSVFVFRSRGGRVEYLFVRHRPQRENVWRPIQTVLRPEDTVARAALKVMSERWHSPAPERLLDLHLCEHARVGDLVLVHWGIGYGVHSGWSPGPLPACVAHACWQPLPEAFGLLEEEATRRAVFRLHLEVAGAA